MSIITINVLHTFEVGPVLSKILEANMADFEAIKRAIADLQAEVDAERAQGADLEKRFTDLETATAGGLTAAQADELSADLDSLKAGIAGIVPDQPGGTAPAPAPEPGPTP